MGELAQEANVRVNDDKFQPLLNSGVTVVTSDALFFHT